MNKKERIKKLLEILNKDIVEKEDFIRISFLATLAGQNIFLYGPPGTAKSLIARRLSMAFETNNYFEHLMNRFSTPEELFGPVSVKELKNDNYIRKTEGYLPKADFAFIDEIWKSSPAILNTLLTIINEKVFKNGNNVEKVPLKILVSASNEIPAENQGLDALYDRFLLRLFVPPIKDADNFAKLLQSRSTNAQNTGNIDDLRIKNDELQGWIESINDISLRHDALDVIHNIRIDIEEFNEKNPKDSIYISDRRWQRAAFLIKASAFYNDREKTALIDCFVLENCLWTSDDNRDKIKEIIKEAIIDYIEVKEVEFDDIAKKLVSIEQQINDKKLKTESFTYLSDIIPTLEKEREDVLEEKKQNEVDSVFGTREQFDAIGKNFNEAVVEIETRLNKAISMRKTIYTSFIFNDIECRLEEIRNELKDHQVTIYEEDSLKERNYRYYFNYNNREYYFNKDALKNSPNNITAQNGRNFCYAEFDGKVLKVYNDQQKKNLLTTIDVHFKGLKKLSEAEMNASKQFFVDALNDIRALPDLIPDRISVYSKLFGENDNITGNFSRVIKDCIASTQTLVAKKMQECYETYMFTAVDEELAKYKKKEQFFVEGAELVDIRNEQYYKCRVDDCDCYLKASDLRVTKHNKRYNGWVLNVEIGIKDDRVCCYDHKGTRLDYYFSVDNEHNITFTDYYRNTCEGPKKIKQGQVWCSTIADELKADYRIVLHRLGLRKGEIRKMDNVFASNVKEPEAVNNFSAVCNKKIVEIDSIIESIKKEYE